VPSVRSPCTRLQMRFWQGEHRCVLREGGGVIEPAHAHGAHPVHLQENRLSTRNPSIYMNPPPSIYRNPPPSIYRNTVHLQD